ncbi:hypothetical protein Tco_1440966 [Tanacetum coccineum]
MEDYGIMAVGLIILKRLSVALVLFLLLNFANFVVTGLIRLLKDIVNLIVESGAVRALVRHLQAPQWKDDVEEPRPHEHEVEKGSAFTLGLLAIKVIIRSI